MRTDYGYPDFAQAATLLPDSKTKNDRAKKGTLTLMGATGVLMIAEMSVHNILMGGFMIASAIIIALPKQSQALFTNFDKLQRKYGANLYAVLFAILAVIFLLNFAAAPANAQFFNNAQTWMTTNFGNANNGQTNAVIVLFFNVLRGLFLLYVGISLVRIVQSARNDEDWQSLARTPLIIVLAVFVGDLIVIARKFPKH
ncbi:hypothetical protein I8752_11135 [Nostocaceae cyanobacterium CENA369]|uniref:Uncharacterized protein n=1 Tax=Dendronalium phyllosphericum CENA369 TaxID=1725256 RepID=A0A8J7I8I8_9NOST|nr:hypothetical protein [Dendronalium phyllosphericum]MBH8573557.1 hypothetical protein [Dendronalium phyllosphericum CENA369]